MLGGVAVYPGFGYISYSEMLGQFRWDIAALQKKFVFRMQWRYIDVIHQVLYCVGHGLVVRHAEVKEATKVTK